MTEPQKDNAARIRALNDEFRRTLTGGRVLATRGVMRLNQESFLQLLDRIRRYDDFNEDNDPYGEHDFGVLYHDGRRIFWKIDYYDTAFRFGSPVPANPAVTGRVLTVMLAEEW